MLEPPDDYEDWEEEDDEDTYWEDDISMIGLPEYEPGWCICGDPEEVCRSYNGGKSCLDKERERLNMDLSLKSDFCPNCEGLGYIPFNDMIGNTTDIKCEVCKGKGRL